MAWQYGRMSATPVPFRRVLWTGVGLLVAGLLLGTGIAFGLADKPFPLDQAWQDFLVSIRDPAVSAFAYAMNWLGGGWFGVFVVPLGGAALLFLAGRRWGAVFFLAAELVSAAFVQVLKHVVGRARPEDMIVTSDFGSFPSGHVANAATLAVALFVIFPRVWVGIAGAVWVVLMAFSRTYLGAHWLSDTVGGALIGAAAALLVAAVFARVLSAETERLRR